MHGTAAHLERISPATKVYRTLKRNFADFSGAPYQGSNHTDSSRASTINRVRNKIKEARIYDGLESRKDFKVEVELTKDIIQVCTHTVYIIYIV